MENIFKLTVTKKPSNDSHLNVCQVQTCFTYILMRKKMTMATISKLFFRIICLVIFTTFSLFCAAEGGKEKKAVTAGEVDELTTDLSTKAKVSMLPAPPVELSLCRQTGADISARYFLRENTVINLQGSALHEPAIFNSGLYHVGIVENLLNTHRIAFVNAALRRNHLIANCYVSVFNTTTDARQIIEGTLYARKIADEGAPGGLSEIEWLMRPNNQGTAGFERANFMSSPYEDPAAGPIDRGGCLPLARADVRPLSDDGNNHGNHGDRLALDTFKNNIDLFFSLIRRTAHREDLQIISMGTRYFSSYDACDGCLPMLYQSHQKMRDSLTYFATRKSYTFFEEGEFNEENIIPFSTFFYASRPYVGTNPGITYYGEDSGQNKRKIAIKIHGNYYFPNVPYQYERPSLIDYDIDDFQIRLNNGVVNKGINDRTVWTYVDKLRERIVGGATF